MTTSIESLIYEISGEVFCDCGDVAAEGTNQQVNQICEIIGWKPKWMEYARRAGWIPPNDVQK